jgi:hypothetical protein
MGWYNAFIFGTCGMNKMSYHMQQVHLYVSGHCDHEKGLRW